MGVALIESAFECLECSCEEMRKNALSFQAIGANSAALTAATKQKSAGARQQPGLGSDAEVMGSPPLSVNAPPPSPEACTLMT